MSDPRQIFDLYAFTFLRAGRGEGLPGLAHGSVDGKEYLAAPQNPTEFAIEVIHGL